MEKDYVETGDYLKAKTNTGGIIHLKTVEIDGELAFLNPFSSQVMGYRYPKKTSVEEINRSLKAKRNAYPTEIVETVEVAWYIDEKPVSQSLRAWFEHRIRQLI